MMKNAFLNFKNRREEGFTLIELLVVILIIGILAAIAIPAFMNQRKEAVDASLKSDVKNLALAMETWRVKDPLAHRYPSAAWRASDTTNPNKSHNSQSIPFSPTEGNEIKVNGITGTTGYCITAWNRNSNYPSEHSVGLYWSETSGGFVDKWLECHPNP